MARGIIGKLVRGAATAGVPMLQEEHKAQILARRDEALNKIQQQYRAEDKKFQTDMNTQNQQFESGQRELDRAARRGEFDATMDIQREGVDLDRDRLELTAQQINQELELGRFGIIDARRLSGIRDVITNPESTPEQEADAVRMLQGLKAESPEKFSAITLYGDEDEFGQQTRQSGILNQSTGVVTPARAGAASQSLSIPPQAVTMLKSDPSPEAMAEFDEIFGEGAAEAALQGN